MFDAEKLLAAFERPTYVSTTGQRTVGRPLSHPQYQQVMADLQAAGDDTGKTEAIVRQALLDMGLPAEEIIALPDPLYWQAIRDFFRCCRGEPVSPPASASAPAALPTS